MNEQIQADYKAEQLFFATAEPPTLETDVIRSVRMFIDSDDDLLILFDNGERRYGLSIVLQSSRNLGWKECQAIVHCLQIAERGTKINNASFLALLTKLSTKYAKVDPAKVVDGVLMGVVYPSRGDLACKTSPVIEAVALVFDDDDDLIVQARTYGKFNVFIAIILPTKSHALFMMNCKAVADVLNIFETGDRMDESKLVTIAVAWRKKYNFVKLIKKEENEYVLQIIPSRVENPEKIESMFVNMKPDVAKVLENLSDMESNRSTNSSAPSYPEITMDKVIKSSGQATIYKAMYHGKDVAVKVFHDSDAKDFKIELRMLLKMDQHPNVIDVLDFFESPQPALVMKLVKGLDLFDYISQKGSLPSNEAKRIALGIASGLAHLHKNGVVHRDVKSPNVLIDPSGNPIIIDLGLGKIADRKARDVEGLVTTMQGLSMNSRNSSVPQNTIATKGTLLWMTPEMLKSQEWSEKTDVYAFGIILWELLSGKVPYVDENIPPNVLIDKIIGGKRPDMKHVMRAEVGLRRLMQDCWDEDPVRRPTMKEVRDILSGNVPANLFRELDTDGSGALDFAEFVTFVTKYSPGTVPPGEMYSLFCKVDASGSGKVTLEDFEKFWRHVETCGLKATLEAFSKPKGSGSHALRKLISDSIQVPA